VSDWVFLFVTQMLAMKNPVDLDLKCGDFLKDNHDLYAVKARRKKIAMISVTKREPTVANRLSSKYCTQRGTFLTSSTGLRSRFFIIAPFPFFSIDQERSIKSMRRGQISKNLLKKMSEHSLYNEQAN